jgi:hypothetical protein
MKRLIKDTVTAKTSRQENSKLFTLSDVGNLLLGINELSDYKIDIKQSRGGVFTVTVGQSEYSLSNRPQPLYAGS